MSGPENYYPPQPGGNPPAGSAPAAGGYPGGQLGGYPQATGQPGGYPGGQPGGYPGGRPGGYPMPPKRSAIPRVMGILMIVFGSLTLLGALFGLATGGAFNAGGPGMEHMRRFQHEIQSMTRTTNLIGLPVAVLQLLAGIWAVRYKRGAVFMANVYAGLAIVAQIVAVVLIVKVMIPAMEEFLPHHMREQMQGMMVGAGIIGAILGMAWQVVLVILMNRPAARAACVN